MEVHDINQKKEVNSTDEYLYKLFAHATTCQGTATRSINEMLKDKALSYGRTEEEAKEDVQHVLNVLAAVKILLKNSAHPRDG